jgi:hypothetical protein
MTQAPEGALRSEDGRWWWDEPARQWQPVGDQATAGDGDRSAARVAAGLPASLRELSDDQRVQFLAEPSVDVELVAYEAVGDVPEMAFSGDEAVG